MNYIKYIIDRSLGVDNSNNPGDISTCDSACDSADVCEAKIVLYNALSKFIDYCVDKHVMHKHTE